MVKVISQETFNEVVKENIQEFAMSPEEAIYSAVEQFEAQGVDLSNIVKELMEKTPADSSRKSLLFTISRVKGLLKSDTALPELCNELSELKAECDKDLAHKILAGKNGAYDLLIKVLESFETNRDVTLVALEAMISLMTGQPDLLEEKGTTLIVKFLTEHIDVCTQRQVLQWAKQCCLKHENNRQTIFNHDIVNILKQFLENGASCALLIRDVCSLIKTLVMDDDIRVEFGKAHEHARSFANEILSIIVDLLRKFPEDKETLSSLLSTLSSLVVTNEFCQLVEEAGGLIFINDVMVNFPDSEKINQQSLWLLKSLAGNDEVKMKVIHNGTAPLITGAMERHRKSPNVTLAGNACIAALSLRSPANSRALCDAGAAEAVVYGMKAHLDRVDVQVQHWLGHKKNPIEWGWVSTAQGLSPKMMSREIAPSNLLTMISCSCKKGCRNACSCRKAGLKCSVVCGTCNGQSCENLPEITVDVDLNTHDLDELDDDDDEMDRLFEQVEEQYQDVQDENYLKDADWHICLAQVYRREENIFN